MNALDCTTALADPIGTIGMSFYFSPQAIAIGETIELDVVTFYAAGRGGVLGEIDVIEVDEVFFFFKDGMVAAMMEKARAGAPRELAVSKHLEAASAFADATFGGIPDDVLGTGCCGLSLRRSPARGARRRAHRGHQGCRAE